MQRSRDAGTAEMGYRQLRVPPNMKIAIDISPYHSVSQVEIVSDNLRSQHLSLISLYIAVVKRITSIHFVLSAALFVSLHLRAADVQTVVVTSSSANSSVVLLQAELAGKETAFSCVTDSPFCSTAPVGEYVMVRAKDAEGI
jgi:hypothetical protein